jgi:hypothetical protein
MSEFEESLIQRLLVVNELGPVHKGDHVLMVANVIVAVDTSRRPDDMILPGVPPLKPVPAHASPPASSAMPRRVVRKKVVSITEHQIYLIVREQQPISSMQICDKLGIERSDLPTRSKVGRLLKNLADTGRIRRHQDERTRVFRYETVEIEIATAK